MHLSQYYNSFIIYNILLIIFFSLTVNGVPLFPILNIICYSIFHFLIIYLGIYYYRKKLYLIYFLYGLGLDLFWINEIGPHLITFMFALSIFYLTFKYLNNLRKLNIKLTDLYLINQVSLKNKSKYKKKSMDENFKIWAFGGSSTAGNNCGKNSSSWPTELSKLNNNIKIYNFGRGGIDSEKSLQKFRNAILSESIPREVWWAHKFNEINVIYQGLRSNKDTINYVFTDLSKKKLKLFFFIFIIETNFIFKK